MSDDNRRDGILLYLNGDAETQAWFEKQWRIWPKRADEQRTTNMSFHYGGVLSYRAMRGRDPMMSRDFASNVAWIDQQGNKP